MKDMDTLLDKYMDQAKLTQFEGRRGVEGLCQLARALGYKDSMYFGQLSSKAALGDLLMFLEDNPGAIEALHNWIRDTNSPEFREALTEQLKDEGQTQIQAAYEDGECPDCGEDIPDPAVAGDECSNCGHVFLLYGCSE
jgi:hypothetical protein